MKRVPAVLASLAFGLFASAPRAETASVDPPTAVPEEVGIDARALERAAKEARTIPDTAMHSILVERGGKLVFERYFTAPDDETGRGAPPVAFNAEKPHAMFSVTKTVVALLVGIARDRGLIGDLDTPIHALLPEYADTRRPGAAPITLRHVLTMSSGLAWNEWVPFSAPENTLRGALYSSDPYRFLLTRPSAFEPGTRFVYNSMGSGLLVAVLRHALSEPVEVFATKNLAEPMGVRDVGWEKFRNGDVVGGWGLSLRPRDMVKLGRLILNGGVWNGKRLVSAEWVAEMTKTRLPVDHRGYGYQMWTETATIDGREVSWVSALGRGGQKIHIVPALDLVVVMTAGYYVDDRQDTVPDGLLRRYILPAALSGAR